MRLNLGKIWRAFGCGLFLTLIGVGGTIMAVTIFPLIALLSRDDEKRRRRIQWTLHVVFKVYCGAIHWMRVSDIEIVGADRLRNLTGTLIVANHPSLLDVVMIMAAIPSVQCVVKAGLWRNPFFRLTVGGAGYIRNDLEPEQLLEACLTTLRSGGNLIIFPEGTRTIPGEVPRLRRGFANLATLAPCNIQPITITCDPPILHKGNPWWRVPDRRSRFRMEVGETLDINRFMGYRFRSLGARKLVEYLDNYYAEKLAHGQPGTQDHPVDRGRFETGRSVA